MCWGSSMKRYNKAGYIYFDTTIDWPQIIVDYNREHGTNFSGEKDIYLRLLLSPNKIAKRLGVSVTTIYKRMDFHGVKRSHKRGGSNNTARPKFDAFLAISENTMKDMTAKMLAVRVRVKIGTIYRFATETGRVFRRGGPNRVKGE